MSPILSGRSTALGRESDVEVGLGLWKIWQVGKRPPVSTLFAQRAEAKVHSIGYTNPAETGRRMAVVRLALGRGC